MSKFYGNGILCNDSIIVLSPRSASISKQATRWKKKNRRFPRSVDLYRVRYRREIFIPHRALSFFQYIILIGGDSNFMYDNAFSGQLRH